MGRLLYRVGDAAYRHRRAVLAAWLVVLLTVGAAAVTFKGKLSNTFTLPGTETERVLDLMAQELPELAGGTGSVVFATQDGAAFTPEQQQAIEEATAKIAALPFVATILDPFEMQAQLDDADRRMADGQAQLNDAEAQLLDGETQLADGWAQIAQAKKELEAGQAEVTANEPTLIQGRAQLEAARIQLDQGAAQLADAKAQLDSGRAELAAGQRQLDQGEAEWAAGQKQIADGEQQIAAARQQLATEQAKIDQFDAGVAELTGGLGVKTLDEVPGALTASQQMLDRGRLQAEQGRDAASAALAQAQQGVADAQAGIDQAAQGVQQAQAEVAAIEAELDALDQDAEDYEAQRDALETQLTDAQSELSHAEEQLSQAQGALDNANQGVQAANEALSAANQALAALDAQQVQLDKAKGAYAQLSASASQVEAGRAQIKEANRVLNQKEAELAAGKRQAQAGRAQLDAAREQLAAGQRELADGQAQYESGLAEYQAGRAEFVANEAQLAEGERQLAEGKAQLQEGRDQIAENEAKLDAAEADLVDGREQLESGRAELERGARLAALSANMAFVSDANNAAISQISLNKQASALTEGERQELYDAVAPLADIGVDALYSQEIMFNLDSILGVSEVLGFLIAGVVLLFMLGTLVAAGLPLLVALLGVAVGAGTTLALSSVIEMQSIAPVLAVMLGLAVGIDYSLFIVNRHRTQMLAGMDARQSVAKAIATSGSAVVFAGMTVVIALSALVVPGLPFLSVLGLSAAFTVLVAILLAITLTPALLAFMGERVLTKKGRAIRQEAIAEAEAGDAAALSAATAAERQNPASRWWAGVVTKHSWLVAAAVVLVLGVIAVPTAWMQTALPDGGSEPEGSDALRSFQVISEEFGEGFNGPLLVMAEFPDGINQAEADDAMLSLAEELSQFDGVYAAVPAATNDALTYGALQVVPTSGPSSPDTEELVHEIRDARAELQQSTSLDTSVTGMVAAQLDISRMINGALAPYLAIVVGLSLILLLVVFRSLAVPLLATAGFLLSLAASFGATVAVYQWGWLGGLFGVHTPGPILSFLPILLTGILFGLAMDYQVFLVTAMKESYDEGVPARRAVRTGFAMAAPVVVAAALIMVSVFAGFIFSHLSMIRPLGFGLALGVLFDAFLVRMTFVPAVMEILGDKAWYLPRWMQRILPKVDVEGASVE